MKVAESKTIATAHRLQLKAETQKPFFQTERPNSVLEQDNSLFFEPHARSQAFFSKPTIQTKLSIGQPGDKYEQEADQMADQVVQGPSENYTSNPHSLNGNGSIRAKIQRKSIFESDAEPSIQTRIQTSANPLIQTKCAECEQEEKLQQKEEPLVEEATELQMQADSNASTIGSPSLESRLSSSHGSGSPLPENTRSQMEGAFGQDFSSVRVHTDSSAIQMNQELSAQAFTHGSDVYFNAGKYDTGSREGQKLLGHELTHVVQQGQSLRLDQVVQKQRAGRRRRPNPATPTLGPCRPVQDDLRPTATWPDLQIGYRARCSSAAADVADQAGRAAEDIWRGRRPRVHRPDARSSIDCACAFGTPEQAAWAAMPVLIHAGPLAAQLYRHFLQGSGTPMVIDVADMIARSEGVRRKIRQSISRGGRTGTTRLEQSDYHDRELQFAYGAIDCVQWTALPPARRSWRLDDTTQIRISMLDYYEFHPARRGVSQCAHAACVELVARGSARNFWTRGEAVISWGVLRR